MRQVKKITTQPTPTSTTQTRQYPSKLISQLMDSDSDNEHQSSQNSQTQDNSYPLTHHHTYSHQHHKTPTPSSTIPPLVTKQKQNISIESNRNQKQIRYSYLRLQGEKVIQTTNPYNSINLEDASMIKDSNWLLTNQLEKLKEERTDMERMICQLVNQNRVLKRQLNITKQELETKDNYYEQVEQQLKQKTKQQQKTQTKIQTLQKQLHQKKQQISRLETQQKKLKNSKKDNQLNQYIQNLNSNTTINKQNYDTGTSYRKNNNDNTDKIYGDITVYIVKRVEQLRDRLISQKMSKQVQNIIQEFMAELVNINPITVSRVVPKSRQACTPVRKYKTQIQTDNSPLIRNSLFRQQQQTTTITPTKPQQKQKQKSQQLRNLQKSLQKLRDMQKSYISTTPQQLNHNSSSISNIGIGKDSYNSLDRSSVMGLDRSKSRRKKIFQ